MKLSIIIPAYNAARYVERCVDSIISQNYSDAEIILVDDGSIDNTLDICRTLSDKHLNIRILHKNNGGVSSARNFGIDNASGEYLMFVDVDDYLLPDTLKDAMDIVEKYHDADFCVFGHNRISRDGTVAQSRFSSCKYRKNDILNYIKNANALTLGSPWSKIFKKAFIDKHGFRFDSRLISFEDICFNLCLLGACSCFATSELCLYCYDVNYQSATAKFKGEIYVHDVNIYMETIREIIPSLATEHDNNIVSEIISSAQKTICFHTIYEIYNLYRQKKSRGLNRYKWLNRLVEFMEGINPEWKNVFSSGFPRLFVLLHSIHPKYAHIMMNLIFYFKRQ